MHQSRFRVRISLWAFLSLTLPSIIPWHDVCANDDDPASATAIDSARAAFIRRIYTITEVVLDQHVDPPTRQEMLHAGIKAACIRAMRQPADRDSELAARPLIAELSRRVSELKSPDELRSLLTEVWNRRIDEKLTSELLEEAFLGGLLNSVPGSATFFPARESKVQDQIAGNRYVGIGVSLGTGAREKPQVLGVFPGGAAEAAGIQAKDWIDQINETKLPSGIKMEEATDLLRGEEGTSVTLQVRQPDSKEWRIVTMVRRPLMVPSVSPLLKGATSGEEPVVNPSLHIGYLNVTRITGSTFHELKDWETKLGAAGVQALILDFRARGSGAPDDHHRAMLLADGLLDGGPLGKLKPRGAVREFIADRDCLFRDWPLAILIDGRTSGEFEWVAAAMQDASRSAAPPRALIIGSASQGESYSHAMVPLPDGSGSVVLATAMVERPDYWRGREPVSKRNRSLAAFAAAEDSSNRWHVTPDFVIDQKEDADQVVEVAVKHLQSLLQNLTAKTE